MPEENEGLLFNLSGSSLTKTMLYLDALMDEQQKYNDYSELPTASNLSDTIVERLITLWRMGGYEQVSYKPKNRDSNIRARWFAEGKGRAYIGYSEAMNAMGDYVDDVDMRCFSYGMEKNIPLFYTDMVGIHSEISDMEAALSEQILQ